MAQGVKGQVGVRVDQADGTAGQDVLDHQAFEELALAGAGGADDIQVLVASRDRHAAGQQMEGAGET